MSGIATETEQLQATLAAEHAAVYVFSLLGARTSQSGEAALYTALRSAYETHRDRRDLLIGVLAAAGESPVGAAPAYEAPLGMDSESGRYAAALALESGCAAQYATLVGSSTATRAEAIGFLCDAAVRELSLWGTPEMFPGADDLADR